LIGQARDIVADIFIGQHEETLLFSECVQDMLADFSGVRATRQIEAEDVDRIVVPRAYVGIARDQQASLLIGKIAHDSSNGQTQGAARSGDLEGFAQPAPMQSHEVL
jgi:hypothetical protein